MSDAAAEEDEARQLAEFEAWFLWKKGANLYETLFKVFGAFADRPFLGTRARELDHGRVVALREYRFLSYSDAWMRAQAFGSGLMARVTSAPQQQLFVAICAANRAEWLLADLASVFYGFALVPIHTTVDVATARFVIEHSDASVLVAQRDVLAKLLESSRDVAALRLVVSLDNFEDFDADQRAAVSAFRARGVAVVTFEALLSHGGAHFVPFSPQTDPLAIFSLLYTSGSTGVPKGAVMTVQRWNNFVCAPYLMPDPVVTLSMAPLAHVAERQGVWLTTVFGGSIGFFNGDMARVFDDFAALNPTMHSAAPRFYNRIHAEFQATLAAQVAAQPERAPADVESEVMRQFSTLLGNRIQFLVTGSAMTSPTVKDFVRRCFGKRLYDGYGTTEAGGIATDDTVSRGVDVRLEDVPDLGYTSSDKPYPRGEICVKTSVMIGGYHKNSAATQAAFTSDGYFRTGDIGQREPNNVVRIIDRKKSVFKLGNGEFVAPEKLEGLFVQSELIAQICVVGDTKWDCLLAVVVPNRRVVEQRHIDVDDDVAVARALVADIRRIGAECALASFEVPWRVLVEWTEFSASNGLLTYSDKLQRRSVEERYRERLHAIYESLSTVETAAVSSEIEAVVAGGDAVDSLSAVRLQSMLRSKFAVDVSVAQLLQADSKEALVRIATAARAGGAGDELSSELQSAAARDAELLAGAPAPAWSASAASTPAADAPLLVTGATGFIGSFVLERVLNGAVTLSVSCAETRPGDSLAVCGAIPELGAWNVADAVPLATSSEAFPRWRCTLALPRDVDIEFKFVMRRAGTLAGEFEAFGGNRRVRLRAGVDCSADCGTFGRLSAPLVRTSPLPSQVVALVRAPTDDEARRRLLDVLRARSFAIVDERAAALRVVAGDVGVPQLGLAADVHSELQRSIGAVVHCAATVNWLSTYAQLRDSNVLGTLNVLLFVRGGCRKRLLHVSTIGVSAGAADGDWLAPQQFVHSSGYNVTKWVAERLVLAHATAAGGAVVVVRPGMVSSHSRTGTHNASDYIPRYVRGCAQLGAFIDDGGARLEMIPVDWAAEQIAALALQSESGVRTVTLSNVARSPTYRAIASAARAVVAGVELLPYARWQQRLHSEATMDNALYPLLTHFGVERLTMQWRALDVTASMRLLPPADGVDTRPIIDEIALERLIRAIVKK